jgi:hypothetical protein
MRGFVVRSAKIVLLMGFFASFAGCGEEVVKDETKATVGKPEPLLPSSIPTNK